METTIKQFKELGDLFATYFRNLGYPHDKIIHLKGKPFSEENIWIFLKGNYYTISFYGISVDPFGIKFPFNVTDESAFDIFVECGNFLKQFTADQTPAEVKKLRENRIKQLESELSLLTVQEVL